MTVINGCLFCSKYSEEIIYMMGTSKPKIPCYFLYVVNCVTLLSLAPNWRVSISGQNVNENYNSSFHKCTSCTHELFVNQRQLLFSREPTTRSFCWILALHFKHWRHGEFLSLLQRRTRFTAPEFLHWMHVVWTLCHLLQWTT